MPADDGQVLATATRSSRTSERGDPGRRSADGLHCGRSREESLVVALRVLVVEDEYLLRLMAVDALSKAGFDVLEVGDGEQALTLCKNANPDVLFTDVQLPGEIDGWEIAERCRAQHPTLAVIYATAFALDERKVVPGSVLFRKPYTAYQLVSLVEALTGPGSRAW